MIITTRCQSVGTQIMSNEAVLTWSYIKAQLFTPQVLFCSIFS